jgi:flagellar hook-associated protein 1 FlgK
MSLSSALNVAVTGLATIQTQIGVVSGNVSNAQTAGYTRKVVNLTTPSAGGQPQSALVASVTRAAAPEIQKDYYSALASYQQLVTESDNTQGLADALNASDTSGNAATLSTLMTNYEDAVKQLEATPEDTALKSLVVQRGQELCSEINRLAGLQSKLQTQAQQDIGTNVGIVNDAAQQIAKLNAQIVSQKAAGNPTGDIEDLRDAEVAKIAGLVGVNVLTDSKGAMSVYTDTGVQIVAGSTAQTFSYDPTANTITNGSGSDVTDGFHAGAITADINYLDSSQSAIGSSDANVGTLAKFFNQLDSLATNVATVVNNAYDDPATPATEQFFTFNTADPAGTLAVNATLVTTPSSVDETRMGAVQQAMETTQLTAADVNPGGTTANGLQIGNVTVFGLLNGILAYHAKITDENQTNRDTADNLQSTLNQKMLNLTAVDVDTEMANLQTLQNNYAALAQVMNAVSQMFDQLMNVGS